MGLGETDASLAALLLVARLGVTRGVALGKRVQGRGYLATLEHLCYSVRMR